jgi:predicted nucleic-acid-binding protein
MLAADTNVWARAYLDDDAAQGVKARNELAKARSEDGIYVPLIVLAELSWVLRGQLERAQVLDMIEELLRTRGVVIESQDLARRAVEAARIGPVGFADRLIAEISFEAGAAEIITFDKAFGRLPRARLLK